MRKFVVGIILGAVLGICGSAAAAQLIGSGSLDGWTVYLNGDEVCTDPDVDTTNQEIDCS